MFIENYIASFSYTIVVPSPDFDNNEAFFKQCLPLVLYEKMFYAVLYKNLNGR